MLSPCLFNLYAEYITRNARLDEAQAGIKIAGRDINNLRYANDNTQMEENKEGTKELLVKEKALQAAEHLGTKGSLLFDVTLRCRVKELSDTFLLGSRNPPAPSSI